MAIAFPSIEGASLPTLGSTNLVINKPSGTVEGDFLVCYIICSVNTTISAPAGWDTDVTAAGIRSYSKMAGGSEPASYTFTRAATTNTIMGVMVRVTGASTSPKDTFGSATGGSGTTVTLPDMTVTNGFTLLQIAEVMVNTSFTPPSGPTELFDQTFATQSFTGAVGIETVAAGATGTRVWTAGTSGVRAGVMYALREAYSGTASATTATVGLTASGSTDLSGSAAPLSVTASGSADGVRGFLLDADSTDVQVGLTGAGGGGGGGDITAVVDLSGAVALGVNSDSSLAPSVTLAAAGVSGYGGTASLSNAVGLTAGGIPGAHAERSSTVGLSADAVVATDSGASLAITASVSAAGSANLSRSASLGVTATVSGAGLAARRFLTPTQLQAMDHGFWGRYSIPVGVSLVKVDGTFTEVPTPVADEMEAAGTEGTDWFRGGYEYVVSEAVWDDLVADGFAQA